MSTPCWDTSADDPRDWEDRRAVLEELQYWGQLLWPDEWRGSDWELVEPTCGPEYRLDWTGFYAPRLARVAESRTYVLPFGGRLHDPKRDGIA